MLPFILIRNQKKKSELTPNDNIPGNEQSEHVNATNSSSTVSVTAKTEANNPEQIININQLTSVKTDIAQDINKTNTANNISDKQDSIKSKNHTPSMVRLSDIGKKHETDSSLNTSDNIKNYSSFNENDVKKVLSEYASSIKDNNIFLSNILSIISFNIIDKTVIELKFANQVNEESFINNKMEIVTYLRTKLNNNDINVKSIVDETYIVNKPYTDSEKLQAMIKKNSQIQYLKTKLKLETDF